MKLNQVTLPATDIEASRLWYMALDFKLIVDSQAYKRLQAPLGGSNTFAIQSRQNGGGTGTQNLSRICIID